MNHNTQHRRPPNLLLEFPIEEIPELHEFFGCHEAELCPFHTWFWHRIFINPTGRRILLVTGGLPTASTRAFCVALGLLIENLRDRLAQTPGRHDHAVVLNEMNTLLRRWFDAACEFPVEPEPEDKAPPPGGRFFPPDDILAN